MTSVLAYVRNVGTCLMMLREPFESKGSRKSVSTKASSRGGTVRSSAEGSVMELERRGSPVQE